MHHEGVVRFYSHLLTVRSASDLCIRAATMHHDNTCHCCGQFLITESTLELKTAVATVRDARTRDKEFNFPSGAHTFMPICAEQLAPTMHPWDRHLICTHPLRLFAAREDAIIKSQFQAALTPSFVYTVSFMRRLCIFHFG